jgi:hypothetical protein
MAVEAVRVELFSQRYNRKAPFAHFFHFQYAAVLSRVDIQVLKPS